MKTCHVKDCGGKHYAKALCHTHYMRERRGSSLEGPVRRPGRSFAERFWAMVDTSDGPDACWVWTGATTNHGYGYFENRVAHRIAWELARPSSLDDRELDHRCFNRSCVNPQHLRQVTRKQNEEHRSGANRNSSTGIRGVYRRSGRYVAALTHNYQYIHVGMFATATEAEAAIRAKRLELFTHNDMDRAAL